MAKHNNTNIYPFDTLVSLDDGLLGFDKDNSKKTRNYKLGDLLGFIIQYIGLFVGNQIISGNITWIGGLTYLVTDLNYWLANSLYTINSGTVTLDDADETHPRLDVIYADSDGNLGVMTGQPSADPAEPILSSTQIAVSVILVNAGATTPAGVSEDIIYSDNLVTDWDNDTTALALVDFDSTLTPYSGTKHINVKEPTNNSVIKFQKDSNVSYSLDIQLSLFIKMNSLVDNVTKFGISLEDEFSNLSTSVTIGNGSYGFNFNDTSEYQSLVIPFTVFLGLSDFDKVVINIGDATGASFDIDHVRLVYGVDDVVITNTFLGLNDTVDDSYVGKEGYRPEVVNGQLKLTPPTSSLVREVFTATSGQTEFEITGNPTDVKFVFEGKSLTAAYSYAQGGSNGTVTMDDGMIIGTRVTIYY